MVSVFSSSADTPGIGMACEGLEEVEEAELAAEEVEGRSSGRLRSEFSRRGMVLRFGVKNRAGRLVQRRHGCCFTSTSNIHAGKQDSGGGLSGHDVISACGSDIEDEGPSAAAVATRVAESCEHRRRPAAGCHLALRKAECTTRRLSFSRR